MRQLFLQSHGLRGGPHGRRQPWQAVGGGCRGVRRRRRRRCGIVLARDRADAGVQWCEWNGAIDSEIVLLIVGPVAGSSDHCSKRPTIMSSVLCILQEKMSKAQAYGLQGKHIEIYWE